MRVKNLLDLLRNLDPNVNVTFKLGYDDEYRQKCAKAEIIDCECLPYLDVDSLCVFPGDASGNPECAFLILEEFNYEKNLDKVAAEFDATYQKQDDTL